jgi:hypothetical protein
LKPQLGVADLHNVAEFESMLLHGLAIDQRSARPTKTNDRNLISNNTWQCDRDTRGSLSR